MLYTAALIDSISGNYHSALQLAIKAWEGQKERLGERQLQSLDSAALVASLLALLGQTKKADGICAETLTALQHSDEASPDPFQTLGVQRVLVSILRQQCRTGKAIATAINACRTAERVFKLDQHPALEAIRMELASAYCVAGEYTKAMQVVDRDIFWKKDLVGNGIYLFEREDLDGHGPWNMCLLEHLHYESRRAHIYGLAEQLEDAENRACKVISLQVRSYERGRQGLWLGTRGKPPPKRGGSLEDGIRAVELEHDLESALDMLSEGYKDRVHPGQAEEDLGGEKPDTAVKRSEDLLLSRILAVVSQGPSETKELGQEIRKILEHGNAEITYCASAASEISVLQAARPPMAPRDPP